MTATMTPGQREILLDWIAEQRDAVTYEDAAHRFGVHYQTARTWMLILRDEGLIEQYPVRKGNKMAWVKAEPKVDEGGVTHHMKRGPFQVARRNEHLSIADWTIRNLNSSLIPRIAHGLAYLYTRSYFATLEDQQHMRGTVPPVEVRTMVLDWLEEVVKDLEVVRQILSYKGVWSEGPELAERFGALPVGGVNGVVEAGQFFHRNITGMSREDEVPMPSPSPPEPEVRTLGDTLREMGVVEEPPTGEVMPPAVEPMPPVESEHPKTLGEVFELQRLKEQNPGLHIVEVDE